MCDFQTSAGSLALGLLLALDSLRSAQNVEGVPDAALTLIKQSEDMLTQLMKMAANDAEPQ
jgi:hypothetical protein